MTTAAAQTQTAPAAQPNGKPAPAAPAAAAPAQAAGTQSAANGNAPPAAPAPGTQAPADGGQQRADGEFARLATAHRKLEKQLKEHQAQLAELETLRALQAGLKDPAKRFELLEQQGVTYDEWTRAKLKAAGHEVPDEEPIDPRVAKELERVKELEQKLAEKDKAEAALRQQQQTRAALDYTRKLLTDGGEAYALAAALGGEQEVLRAFLQEREESGADPDEKAIAAKVEAAYEQRIKQQLGKIAATAKGRALLAAVIGTSEPATEPGDDEGLASLAAGQRKKRSATSVSNELAAQRGEQVDERKLSLSERRARILKRIETTGS